MNEKEINVPEGLPEKYWHVAEAVRNSHDVARFVRTYDVKGLLSDLATANREILELKQKINSYMALEKLRTGITRIENMELPK